MCLLCILLICDIVIYISISVVIARFDWEIYIILDIVT